MTAPHALERSSERPPIMQIDGNHVVAHPPFLFNAAHFAIRHKIKGGWKLLALLQNTILRGKVAAYRLTPASDLTLYAPLFRPESSKTLSDICQYEIAVINCVVDILSSSDDKRAGRRDIWLVDAGADIGMVSAQMIKRLPGLERIFGFEPNDSVRPYLTAMLASSGVEFEVFAHALGSVEGPGRMASPPEDQSEHAYYFVPDETGPVTMTRIDSLPDPTGKTVLLKVDVEGGETEVFAGAAKFLARADQFVAMFEAHPKVIDRTGKTPDDIIKQLCSIKPCTLHLAGQPSTQLDPTKPIMAQIPDVENGVHNLVCSSIEEPQLRSA